MFAGETEYLLTDADIRTDTILEKLQDCFWQLEAAPALPPLPPLPPLPINIESLTATKPGEEGVSRLVVIAPMCTLRKSPNIFVFSLNPIYNMSSKLLHHVDQRIFVKSGPTFSLCFLVTISNFFTKSFSYCIQQPDQRTRPRQSVPISWFL